MIYGERIKQARELNGLTQKELAITVGCKQSAIAHFETNRSLPSRDTIKVIGKATGFLEKYFEKEPVANFSAGSLAYRSKRSTTKREAAQAYQYASIVYECTQKMSEAINIPDLRLPKIAEGPELSAKVTRAALGISPEIPIGNFTNIFEKNGGFVFVAPFILSKIDALSSWAKFDIERPMIVVSSCVPGDRFRFSSTHELGHLVMHNPPRGKIVGLEKEANKFASEFLMPKEVIKRELVSPVTLTSLMKLKRRWGVSLQALIYRTYELGIITERHYHYLFEQLSRRGWRKTEPRELDIPIEYPKAFNKMLSLTYSSINDYALDMGLEPGLAQQIAAFN